MGRRRRRCGVCPKFDKGWCPIRAEMRPPDAPACVHIDKFLKKNKPNESEVKDA